MADKKKDQGTNEPIPPIPASPEEVGFALVNSPPRKPSEWKYMKKSKRRKTSAA